MLKNYLKIAIRNLSKHKGYSFINIFGLAVGICCCLLIFLYVKDELTYDRFQSKANRIYRINSVIDWFGNKDTMGATNRVEAFEYTQRIPEIVDFTRFSSATIVVQKNEEWVQEYGSFYTDPGTFRIFDFRVLDGSLEEALSNINSVVINRTMAEKYFGSVKVAGRQLNIKLEGNVEKYVIDAVFEDLPHNSSLYGQAYFSWQKFERVRPLRNPTRAWSNIGYTSVVLLDKENVDIQLLEQKLKEVRLTLNPDEKEGEWARNIDSKLQAFTSIHLDKEISSSAGLRSSSNPTYSYILSGIGFLILLLACINFANLSVARSIPRAKEIGIRKVLGARKKQVAWQFLGEALYISIIAFVLGLILAELFLPTFSQLTNKSFSSGIIQDAYLVLACLGVVALSALLAGAYPAFVVARFQILKSLSGKVKLQGRQYLTKGLVLFQFAIAAILVIGTLAMNRQISFLLNTDLGYEDKNMAVMQLGGNRSQAGVIMSELLKNPNISMTSYSDGFGSATSLGYNNKEFFSAYTEVDTNFIHLMDLDLVAGRNLKPLRDVYPKGTDTLTNLIVTENFIEKAGIEGDAVGTFLTGGGGDDAKDQYRIVGVVKDFIYSSAKNGVSPVVMIAGNPDNGDFGSISMRYQPEYSTQLEATLNEIWRKVDPYTPLQFFFQEEINRNSYGEEKRWKSIITTASVIAIIISCLGLFGMAHLSAQQRQKEIGVRKVLGATVGQLVYMLNLSFTKLVLLASLVAIPVAYYFLDDWLSNFAFRINLGALLFLAPTLLTLSIALLTVTVQSFRTASANPVDSLRDE
ncbi:ABC transporter permease [Roseivirga sp. UBA838]|uniref:ABC transporter permease n=1 Tax=Roseivirga sp. UBA838 TaxID=1947393 RepID=UPI00257E2E13|nr:ABC transporter permease [Roseivirga sp. UBA838]|tara:strand:+ start:14571 stop:16985 length:2415 start_codon:yes stop_codon:yes gene_type:complete